MIEKLRLFLVIIEEGSLRRTAERLHISQSAITRQIQLLEHDLGGRIFERTSSGVRPTSGGHVLARKARRLLADYDSVMAEVRRMVRGQSDRLRIGYVATAVQEYPRRRHRFGIDGRQRESLIARFLHPEISKCTKFCDSPP